MSKNRELNKLNKPKDLRYTAVNMSKQQVKYLISTYTQLGKLKQAGAIHRKILAKSGLDHELIKYIHNTEVSFVTIISDILDIWTDTTTAMKWAKSIRGIGPFFAAAMGVYIDLDYQTNIGKLWAYAGMDPPKQRDPKRSWTRDAAWALLEECEKELGPGPTEKHVKWIAARASRSEDWFMRMTRLTKGETSWPLCVRALRWRTYNPTFRQICLKMGKLGFQSHKSLYQDLYYQQKEIHWKRGLHPEHTYARARRYAVKAFLAHFWTVSMVDKTGESPKQPYALEILDGKKRIIIPNWPFKKVNY